MLRISSIESYLDLGSPPNLDAVLQNLDGAPAPLIEGEPDFPADPSVDLGGPEIVPKQLGLSVAVRRMIIVRDPNFKVRAGFGGALVAFGHIPVRNNRESQRRMKG